MRIKLPFFAFIASIALTGCPKGEERLPSNVIVAQNVIGNTENISEVYFTIGSKVVYADFENNGFRLTLPDPMPENELVLVNRAEILGAASIHKSDPGAKIYGFIMKGETIIDSYWPGGTVMFSSIKGPYTEIYNIRIGVYFYADRPVHIKGDADLSSNAKVSIDLPLNKGWNRAYYEAKLTSKGEQYVIKSGFPADLRWGIWK